MNERIRELAEQADIKFRISSIDPQFWSDKEESLEKFAELIVRECIEQVEVFNVRMDARPRHIVEAIKSHFGVENE